MYLNVNPKKESLKVLTLELLLQMATIGTNVIPTLGKFCIIGIKLKMGCQFLRLRYFLMPIGLKMKSG